MRPRRLLCLILLLACSPHLEGKAPSLPVAPPTQVNRSTAADYSKEPYVFELIEEKVRFEADGTGQRQLSVRVRVQSESAVRELGLLAYPYNSAFESLDLVFARVLKSDGTTVETPPSEMQDLDSPVSREAPMYTDQREKHIAVKALSAGDTLEFKLRWTTHDPIAPGHFWFDSSFFRAGICLKQVVEISTPREVAVKVKAEDPQPAVQEDGKFRIYTFTSSNLAKIEPSKIPTWEKDFQGVAPPPLRL
jgi:hypothetical protein